MKQRFRSRTTPDQQGQGFPPLYLAELPPPRQRGPLEWWYRLTAPPEPPPSADFRRHEAARRGRLISLLLLLMICLVFVVIPIALFTGNYPLMGILGVGLLTECVTLALNRHGRVLLAGILIVSVIMIGYILAQTFNPGGLRVGDLPDFDLLVWVELLAVSLLPARSVFVVAALDSFFIWADVAFQPHAPDLAHFLVTDGYAAIGRPITIQIIVAIVAYLWVRSATSAIARADRAEVIAALEHAMAVQQRESHRQTQELQESIVQLVETHRRVAAGDFRARVHLLEEDVLAPVADSLNLLLVRFQRLLAESEELERTKVQAARVVAALRESSVTDRPPQLPEQGVGTTVDLIILELLSYLRRRQSAMKQESAPILEAVDLCRSSGETPALSPLSLSVQQGEIFGILGPPGAGKTALFNLLSGKSVASSGTLKILGKDFWRNARELRRQMGVVSAPEHDLNTPGLEHTAREHLNFEADLVGFPHQKYPERINGVLARVGLAAYDNLRVDALPGALKRRLVLARALLSNPLLLLIDEPTAGVAEGERQGIWEILRSLRDEGKTLVLTTSSWEEAQEVCDRVATLSDGALQLVVTP